MSLLKAVLKCNAAGEMKLVHRFLITILRNVLYRLRFIEV